MGLLHCQGTKVMLSECLLSSLVRPVGALEVGMPDEASDQAMMSLMA